MRIFVGLPLTAAVTDELSAISQRLQSDGDGLRWSAPESWHISLQFLGNAGQEQLECTAARLHEIPLTSVPIWIAVLGLFDRAGIAFVGVRPTPEPLLVDVHASPYRPLTSYAVNISHQRFPVWP